MNYIISLAITTIATISLSACGSTKHSSVLKFKKPPTLSKIDAQIITLECNKKGLKAFKAAMSANPKANKGPFPSKARRADFAATDNCLKSKGFKVKRRNYRAS